MASKRAMAMKAARKAQDLEDRLVALEKKVFGKAELTPKQKEEKKAKAAASKKEKAEKKAAEEAILAEAQADADADGN